jgi:hypothetical protein
MLAGGSVKLIDGVAEHMGDGMFVLIQKDERGSPQNVVVAREDLERMLAAS